MGEDAPAGDVPRDVLGHVFQLFYGDLHLCGCGNPEDAYDLVRDILILADGQDRWVRFAQVLIGNPAASHMILSALEEADLIGHGMSMDSSWLTDKGRWYVAALRRIDSWSGLGDAGFPHYGEGCTDACWTHTVA